MIFWPMRLHPVLIIQSNCSYILALILDWATIICSSVLETTLHLVVKLSFDIYLLITVQFCSPNLDKKFFYWFQHWFFLWFFLFSSKFHSSFKIVLMKKECDVVCSLSFSNICVFFLFHWPVFTRLFRIIIAYIESKNQHHFIPFLNLKRIYF